MEGLALSSYVIESIVCSISVAYNLLHAYPFSTYGDGAICLLQNWVIIGLILLHRQGLARRTKAATVLCLAAAAAFLHSPACAPTLLILLQTGTVVMMACARIPQILLNLRRGNSGELSMASTGLSVIGNAMRVFTTLALVKDPFILVGAGSQLCLNGILLWQTMDTARQRSAVAAAG